MRKIEQSGQFKKDLKRESKGRFHGYLRENFTAVVKALACDQPLDARSGTMPLPEIGKIAVTAISARTWF